METTAMGTVMLAVTHSGGRAEVNAVIEVAVDGDDVYCRMPGQPTRVIRDGTIAAFVRWSLRDLVTTAGVWVTPPGVPTSGDAQDRTPGTSAVD